MPIYIVCSSTLLYLVPLQGFVKIHNQNDSETTRLIQMIRAEFFSLNSEIGQSSDKLGEENLRTLGEVYQWSELIKTRNACWKSWECMLLIKVLSQRSFLVHSQGVPFHVNLNLNIVPYYQGIPCIYRNKGSFTKFY